MPWRERISSSLRPVTAQVAVTVLDDRRGSKDDAERLLPQELLLVELVAEAWRRTSPALQRSGAFDAAGDFRELADCCFRRGFSIFRQFSSKYAPAHLLHSRHLK